MRVVILLVVIATAVAELSPSTPVPVVLEGATPAEVLLYLYDVVLTSVMSTESNDKGGGIMNGHKCPGNMPILKSTGMCAPTTEKPDPFDYFSWY